MTSESEREDSISQKETRTKTKAKRRNNARYTKKDFEKTERNQNEMEIEQERIKRKKNPSGSEDEGKISKKTRDCISLNDETEEKIGKPIVKSFKTIVVNKEIIEIEDLDETSDPVEENISYVNVNPKMNTCPAEIETKLSFGGNKGELNDGENKKDEPTSDRNNSMIDYTIFAKGKNTNITKQNPIKIQSEIHKAVGRRIEVRKSGDSLRICCTNEAQRRAMRMRTTIGGFEVSYSDPYKKTPENDNMRKGIIFGVDFELSDEEICKEIGASSVRRIKKKIGGREIETAQILILYKNELPPYVLIGWRRHRVDKFVPDPIRCYQCQRYGHKANTCNGQEKCGICSKRHNVKECPEKNKSTEEKESKCPNCGGKHSASYRGCPKFKIAKQITRIQFSSESKMTYAEAIKKQEDRERRKNENSIPAENDSQHPSLDKNVVKIPDQSIRTEIERRPEDRTLTSASGNLTQEAVGGGREDHRSPPDKPHERNELKSTTIADDGPMNEETPSKLYESHEIMDNDSTVSFSRKALLSFLRRCSEETRTNKNKDEILQSILVLIKDLISFTDLSSGYQ